MGCIVVVLGVAVRFGVCICWLGGCRCVIIIALRTCLVMYLMCGVGCYGCYGCLCLRGVYELFVVVFLFVVGCCVVRLFVMFYV